MLSFRRLEQFAEGIGRKMRNCELCKSVARMYCESDQASLCWICDEKVHCANFLVAKHSRSLLCQICQSPTPWKASGSRFSPTVSICEGCVESHEKRDERGAEDESHGENEEENVFDDYDEEESDEEEEEEEEEEEDVENQVVPWSCTSTIPPPPPPVASSSSSEGESTSMRMYSTGGGDGSALKRNRQDLDLDSDDENGCCSSKTRSGPLINDKPTSVSVFRPLKQPKTAATVGDHNEDSKSTALINSLKGLQKSEMSEEDDASAMIDEICKLSRDQSR